MPPIPEKREPTVRVSIAIPPTDWPFHDLLASHLLKVLSFLGDLKTVTFVTA
jgi:hypothetical protein